MFKVHGTLNGRRRIMNKTARLYTKTITRILLIILTAGILSAYPARAASGVPVRMADSSIRLLREVMRKTKSGQNILISPDSILTAVVMVENGAAKSTLSEMESALGNISVSAYTKYLTKLHKRLMRSSSYKYLSANSVWYKKGTISLKKKYRQTIKSAFDAETYGEPFDTATVNKMNAWVSENTNGKIPSIINRLTPSDRVVVLNAVYFKGAWSVPYEDTTRRRFTKSDGTTQKVEMLEGTEKSYVQIDGASGFVKTYKGGKLAFLALLPPKNTSVRSYLKKLSGADLINGYKNRREENIVVYTRMPEFSYDFSISLKAPLKRMGIKKAFSKDSSDFSKMSSKGIHIDDVIHKTHIDLTKEGTEAAAATAVVMKANSIRPVSKPTVKKVYLNRPFIYAIIDSKTGIPLFLGVVNKI